MPRIIVKLINPFCTPKLSILKQTALNAVKVVGSKTTGRCVNINVINAKYTLMTIEYKK